MKTRAPVSKASSSSAGEGSVNWLQRGLNCWELRFEGRSNVMQHSRGLLLIAQLLARPHADPIHAWQLAEWADPSPMRDAVLEMGSPRGPAPALVTATSKVSQRSLFRDDLKAVRRLRLRARELQLVLEDPCESEIVKAEVEEELGLLNQEQRQHLRMVDDAPRRGVRAVRRAILRTIQALVEAVDYQGRPVPVLHGFALHLHQYLVVPSSRYVGPKSLSARSELAGCFQYAPPKGVRWIIR